MPRHGQLIVAEGVETKEEQNVLLDLKCDLLQGYLLARPSGELSLAPEMPAFEPVSR